MGGGSYSLWVAMPQSKLGNTNLTLQQQVFFFCQCECGFCVFVCVHLLISNPVAPRQCLRAIFKHGWHVWAHWRWAHSSTPPFPQRGHPGLAVIEPVCRPSFLCVVPDLLQPHGFSLLPCASSSPQGMGKKDDPKLMQEWFKLVQEKNALVRYESELMIL